MKKETKTEYTARELMEVALIQIERYAREARKKLTEKKKGADLVRHKR